MITVPGCRRPVILVIAVNILAFALLCLYYYKGFVDWRIAASGLIIPALIYAAHIAIVKKDLGDEYLFLIVSMLASLGFIMIYRLDRELGLKQIIWFITGIFLFFSSLYVFTRVKSWHRFIYYYIAVSLSLFVLTLVLGRNIRGSTNWIVINGYSFQPSEIIKILYVFFLACCYKSINDAEFIKIKLHFLILKIGKNIFLTAVTYIYIVFLILQRDWGMALLFLLVYFIEFYVFSGDKKFLLANSAAASAIAVVSYAFTYHIKVRVEAWLNPWADIAGKGYQIAQSLFAISSGGFFGTGIGRGKPDLIPEVSTDFIFSAICEEMGIFGGVSVILMYFILSYRGFKIVMTVRDRFKKSLALGITVIFGMQVFIIIGGVIKLIPLTGITLPFISYGGSSLTTSFIALGILQAISVSAHETEEDEANDGE